MEHLIQDGFKADDLGLGNSVHNKYEYTDFDFIKSELVKRGVSIRNKRNLALLTNYFSLIGAEYNDTRYIRIDEFNAVSQQSAKRLFTSHLNSNVKVTYPNVSYVAHKPY